MKIVPGDFVHSLGGKVKQVAERKLGVNRVFVDMDGVIVDFDAYMKAWNMTGDEVKKKQGAYLEMPAIHGAIQAVRSLIGMGFEVWIATKPPTGVPYAYSDKAAWVMRELPELKRRIIITHDKGLLGDSGDFLCDDRPHKANCQQFKGVLLPFVDGFHWPQALEYFRRYKSATQPNADGNG
jgi:5'(3')-deoxyribonucleotidase